MLFFLQRIKAVEMAASPLQRLAIFKMNSQLCKSNLIRTAMTVLLF